MATRESLNGWPDLSTEAPTREEFGDWCARVVIALDWLRGFVIRVDSGLAEAKAASEKAAANAELAFGAARAINDKIDALAQWQRAQVRASLPPMRAEAPSRTVLADQATEGVAAVLSERAKQTPGPTVDATPKEIANMVRPVVLAVLEARDNEANARFVKRSKWLFWGAVMALLTAVAGSTWGWVSGRALGYSEARSHAPAAAASH